MPTDPRNVIVVDAFGFCEFPRPEDSSKHTLNFLLDPEEEKIRLANAQQAVASVVVANPSTSEKNENDVLDTNLKEFWMPDNYCRACYACEDPFTMFR